MSSGFPTSTKTLKFHQFSASTSCNTYIIRGIRSVRVYFVRIWSKVSTPSLHLSNDLVTSIGSDPCLSSLFRQVEVSVGSKRLGSYLCGFELSWLTFPKDGLPLFVQTVDLPRGPSSLLSFSDVIKPRQTLSGLTSHSVSEVCHRYVDKFSVYYSPGFPRVVNRSRVDLYRPSSVNGLWLPVESTRRVFFLEEVHRSRMNGKSVRGRCRWKEVDRKVHLRSTETLVSFRSSHYSFRTGTLPLPPGKNEKLEGWVSKRWERPVEPVWNLVFFRRHER